MTWDKDGKVYLNGSPVLGADLWSLLRHAATRRAATALPEGYEPIFQHMDSQQLPRSMYVNPVWRKPTLDSDGDPFESGSERGDIAGAEGYTLPPSFMPTTQDSKAFGSFLPSPEWESIADDEDNSNDDTLGPGVRKRKRKKAMTR